MKTKTDYIEFIRKRINDLRMEHNLSEYQLSRALGDQKDIFSQFLQGTRYRLWRHY